MNKLFFDEAGNTGDNFLDPDQTHYLLLSHNFSEEETREILAPLLAISKAEELHFKNIRKYASQKNALIECFHHVLIQKNRAHFFTAHKEFTIFVQIIDKLIEPVLYEEGIDIYERGSNIGMANLFYILAERWDQVRVQKMLSLFVRWVRSKKTEDEDLFYKTVSELSAIVTLEEEKMLLGFILLSRKHTSSISKSFGKYTLDITLSCLVSHCNYWTGINDGPFDILFDDSKQLEYWRGMIDFLRLHVPEAVVGYGSRKHKYPLPINSLKTMSSKGSLQLQLADLIASSLNHFYVHGSTEKTDSFANLIFESNLKNINGGNLWPSQKVTPEDLDMEDESGQNALDFIAGAAKRNPEAYAKVELTKK